MKVLVILAHPKAGSLNHSIAAVAIDSLIKLGHEVIFHDLYAERFDPVITHQEIQGEEPKDPLVCQHCTEAESANGYIFVHPNWWGQPPAILKGWIDRVLRPGLAYQFASDDNGGGVPIGLLKERSAIVFNTSNTATSREIEVFKDPLETLWKNCILGFCGINDVYRKTFSIVCLSGSETITVWLDEVRERVIVHFPFPHVEKLKNTTDTDG